MSSNRLLKVGLSLGLGLLFSSMAYADDPTNIHTREAIDTREVITTPDTPVISTRKAASPHLMAGGGSGAGNGMSMSQYEFHRSLINLKFDMSDLTFTWNKKDRQEKKKQSKEPKEQNRRHHREHHREQTTWHDTCRRRCNGI